MNKQAATLIIVIGIASIIAALFGAFRSGELLDALSGVIIGVG